MRSAALICIALVTAGITLGGCANQNSIFRQNVARGKEPVVFTVDAKQRHLLVVPDASGANAAPGQTAKSWRVCAEAAPDVFSALSTSAAADLGFGQRGAETEARAQAAIAIAEAAGTIERTQTINMLRESMYRTCERYLSGAINEATFVVQAGRDWRMMISILAIEQLTRTARPPATIIAAGTTSASVENVGEATRELIAAQGRVTAATSRQRAAEDGPPAVCPPPAEPAPTDEQKTTCTAKERAIARAKADLDQAKADVATWEAVLKSGITEKSSAQTGPGTSDPGGFAAPGSTSDMTGVALVVGDIVRWAFNTDETQLFCLQVLRDVTIPSDVTARCTRYLMDKVESERLNLFANAAVRTAGDRTANLIQAARIRVGQYLQSLPVDAYEVERQAIAARLGTFCDGLTRDQCAASVRNGQETDGKEELALATIDERVQLRRTQ